MQRSRFNREQKEDPINSESTGELPRQTYQSEDRYGGPAACKTEQRTGDDQYLPVEEEIITGSHRWHGWDIAGPAEGKCGTAWPGEMHHERSCMDAAWGSVLEDVHPIFSETVFATEGGIGSTQASGAAPHSTTPPRRVTLWTDASGKKWVGFGRGMSAPQPNFTTPSHIIRESRTSQ